MNLFNKFKAIKLNQGMTYVELIVVLSIFAVMSSVAIFNHGDFQARVDIRNLANDIALKIVQAQKESSLGKLPPLAQQQQGFISQNWKPSYGIFMTINSSGGLFTDNKSFIYFVDLDNSPPSSNPLADGVYTNNYSCPVTAQSKECLEKIIITKGNYISRVDVFYQDGTNSLGLANGLDNVNIVFKRPNAAAILNSTPAPTSTVSYFQISISSPKGATATIKVFPSGKIQVN
jgi:prepilin-type N-terminal cleavage/methylation domain-containing protein